MKVSVDVLVEISKYAAAKWCPVEQWREDAASEAIVRMLQDEEKHVEDLSQLTTYLINLAKWGIQDYLRWQWGRDYAKMEINHRGRRLNAVAPRSRHTWEEVLPAPGIPADRLVYIAMRCDNIDKAKNKKLTVAQQRGNLPIIS